MNIGRITSWAAWLLAAGMVAGCATQAGAAHPAPDAGTHVGFLGETAMTANELLELGGQPLAEQRRRLDVVLAPFRRMLPDVLGKRDASKFVIIDPHDFHRHPSGS